MKNGFTLAECMVAIVIVAILATLAVPGYQTVRLRSQIQEANNDVRILASAIHELAWDTGKWPGGTAREAFSSTEIWSLSDGQAGLLANDGRFPNWQGPYVPKVPTTDPWGQPYFFDADYWWGGRWRVAVGSFGPNRIGRNRYDSDDILIFVDE